MSRKPYILNRGRHARHEDRGAEGRICYHYVPGDEILLTDEEAASRVFAGRVTPSIQSLVTADTEPVFQPGDDTDDTDTDTDADDIDEETEDETDPDESETEDSETEFDPRDLPWNQAVSVIKNLETVDAVNLAIEMEQKGSARASVLTAAANRLAELEE